MPSPGHLPPARRRCVVRYVDPGRPTRGRPRFGEPSNDNLVIGERPRAGHDSTDDHDVCPTADQHPPGRRPTWASAGRDRAPIGRSPAGIERQTSPASQPVPPDPRAGRGPTPRRCPPQRGGHESPRSMSGSACGQRPGPRRASNARGQEWLARTPGSTPRPHPAQPRRGQAAPPSAGCDPDAGRSYVRLAAGRRPGLPATRAASVTSRPVGKGKAQMPEPGPGGDRRAEFVPGHRPVGKHVSDNLPKEWPVGWRQAVEALPAGELPHPTGGPQRKVRATVLGRHQVGGAAKRERLNDPRAGRLAVVRDACAKASQVSGLSGLTVYALMGSPCPYRAANRDPSAP